METLATSASFQSKVGSCGKTPRESFLDDSEGISCASSSKDSYLLQSTETRKKFSNTDDNKPSGGLRLYGRLVLEKLKQKVTTNFDEVVTEIHKDLIEGSGLNECTDLKNIRRRVYDVLNVLCALGIVSKNEKDIKLVKDRAEDLPERLELEKERKLAEESMEQKKAQLKELLLQTIAYKSLLCLKRNARKQKLNKRQKIDLPFIIVKNPQNTAVNCEVSEDRLQHLFTFEHPFEILDDLQVIQRMGLAFGLEAKTSTVDQLREFEKMVSKELDQECHCGSNKAESSVLSKCQNLVVNDSNLPVNCNSV